MAFRKQSLILFASFIFCLPLCFAEDSVFTDIVSRVKALENEDTHQRQILHEQRADLQMLQNVVQQQSSKLLYQTKLIKDFMRRVNLLEMKIVVLQTTKSGSKHKDEDVQQPEETVNLNDEKNTNQEMQPVSVYKNSAAEPRKEKIRQDRAADTPVAFQAVFKGAGQTNIGLHQIIAFPDVVTNLGGGYHSHQGLFIAPRSGVYIFSTSITSGDNIWIEVEVIVNANRIASVLATGNTGAEFGQGAVTVVSQLTASDEVLVRLRDPTGSSLLGDYYSSFMGCLVYP